MWAWGLWRCWWGSGDWGSEWGREGGGKRGGTGPGVPTGRVSSASSLFWPLSPGAAGTCLFDRDLLGQAQLCRWTDPDGNHNPLEAPHPWPSHLAIVQQPAWPPWRALLSPSSSASFRMGTGASWFSPLFFLKHAADVTCRNHAVSIPWHLYPVEIKR